MQRRVVCAAIRHKYTQTIICGVRHFDHVMHQQIGNSVYGGWATAEQGFIDQRGNFMSREEALAVAIVAGQIIRRVGRDNKELFSENLY